MQVAFLRRALLSVHSSLLCQYNLELLERKKKPPAIMGSMVSFMQLGGLSSISSATTLMGGVLAAWLLYHVFRALYNVSAFHPLHQFPGPKLAAATILYEFWFDMVLCGRYTREIKRMHEVYGESVNLRFPGLLYIHSPPSAYDNA